MTTDVEAIEFDASGDYSAEAVADMYLARKADAQKNGPSSDDVEDDLETDSSDQDLEDADADEAIQSDEGDESGEDSVEIDEAEEPSTPTKKRVDDDEAVVTVRYNDEDIEVSVKDLKRLYGQEKSLTRKSEELSEVKRKAEELAALNETSLRRQYDKAREAYAKYEGVNLNVLAMREGWDADTLELVTEQERAAWANLSFYDQELRSSLTAKQQAEKARADQEAREAMTELTDPVRGIKGFSLDHYNTLLGYAISDLELDAGFVRNLTNAKLIKALDRLYRLETGAKTSAKALETRTTKPVAKAPLKVLKSSSEPAAKATRPSALKAAEARARELGTAEAVAEYAMLKRKYASRD